MTAPTSIAQWRDQIRAAKEHYETSMAAAETEAMELELSVASPDEAVVVTVRGDLTVRDIEFDDDLYYDHDADRLSQQIIETYNEALKLMQREKFNHVHSRFQNVGNT